MSEAKKIWQDMLSILETELTAISFDVWIKPLDAVDIVDGKLVLLAPTQANKDEINNRLLPLIKKVMQQLNPLLVDVSIIMPNERDKYETAEEQFSVIEDKPQPKEAPLLNPKYNFDNFVVGKSNQFVFAAASAVAADPGKVYNPLFIYGGVGLGKTHIMHAIGNYVRQHSQHLKVLYVSSEKFVNELITCLGKRNSDEFRDKYRNVDVLMIDDIQFLAGKTATQEEIFHTFNDLYHQEKQLVFTSDRPPKEIADLTERLRTRFEWGLIADIQPPDLETRIAILQNKARLEKYNVPIDVLTYMAMKVSNNIREMESILNKVMLLAKLYDRDVTIELAEEALKDYKEPTEEIIDAEDIVDCCCQYFSIKKEDIKGKKRDKDIVEPRQICIYLIAELLPLPLTAIGSIMGGRDHTTIMHAKNKVANNLSQPNSRFKVAVDDIRNMIYKK